MGRQQQDYHVHNPCIEISRGPVHGLSEEALDLIAHARSQAKQVIGPSCHDRARVLRKLLQLWAAE
jgi:hypothetical protein